MSSLQQMQERKQKLADTLKTLSVAIRKAEGEERIQNYINIGKDIEQLFLEDHGCSNSQRLTELCSRYFGQHEPKNPSGKIASFPKKLTGTD